MPEHLTSAALASVVAYAVLTPESRRAAAADANAKPDSFFT
jgi:hypothetical protein